MDSPEVTVKTSAAAGTTAVQSSNSPPVQESPFSNFLRNLSPIEPDKGQHVSQGFLGLNSPPLAFTSPRINALREGGSMKRPRYHLFPGAEVSTNDDGCKMLSDCIGELGKSDPVVDAGLAADTKRESDMKILEQVQPDISSKRVGEYLVDQAEADRANSTAYKLSPNLKQYAFQLQSSVSSVTYIKESLLMFDNNIEKKVDAPLAFSRKAVKKIQGESTFDINSTNTGEEQACSAFPSNEYNAKSNCSIDLAFKNQQCENTSAQDAVNVHKDKSDCTPQLLPEPLQIAQTYKESEEDAGAIILHGLVDNTMHDTEANQHQRGFSRRCLRFVEAQPKAIASSSNSSNLANDVTSLRSPATLSESEGLDSSHVDLNSTSSQRQMVNLSQPLTPMFPPRPSGKSPLTISKPSGIGLHLNSIVNALPQGGAATVGIKLASSECGVLENKASIAVSSIESHATGHLNLSLPPGHHETPQTKRKFNTEHGDNFEEFNQSSPKKKRRKSSTIDSDGCKRCNCKKTQCLKLYCDCFAAGIYCAESCACQGCHNRPEYEDTVLETRQQIESRNPLAFAPKIVQRVTDFPVNDGDDGKQSMPSSAKHKRGCNCKKSMCLKKYCECYQASVGCSDGCRCEGCKNSYGRKEDYVGPEEMLGNRAGKERPEGMFGKRLEMVTSKRDFLRAEFYDPHLTPVTPTLQCPDHGKDEPKSRLLSRRYVPSPDSDPNITTSYANTPRSLKNSDSNDMLLETSKEILDVDSYGQEGMDYRNEDMMDQLSSRCDALAELCHLTPLPDFSSMAAACSGSSKATDWKNLSRLQFYPRNDSFSSSRSLHWRSSPVTPITQLTGNKNIQEPDSDSRVYDISEDGTPDILRESSTPIKPVKVSSPNRKRVSPPQNHVNEPRSSTSGALKSRKFILKAISSFPPLTPCIDSKSSTNPNRSDLQENKE